MRFDLTRPCKDCPFRTDIRPYLHPERAREIAEYMTKEGKTFPCHKTVTYDGPRDRSKEQHCAGALIFAENTGGVERNQMLRIAMRLRIFDPEALDTTSPVYRSVEDMVRAADDMARTM